ncbi:MAG: class I SAM-dependent methyltransferase [Candidatus Omnitrophota bacterium]|jgi:SAM-dependent methyltransferase|nr:MAG: class I SAM-dependent methyltransferase [Candidatus Omnitrophota bacterium]
MKFYDHIAASYDYFIDWESRIKREDPFYQQLFQECLAKSILDLGCGTGGHAMHWADMGYNVIGVDSSREMIAFARDLAEKKEIDIEFQCLQMTDFASRLQTRFDAVICVGNTVAHLLDAANVLRLFHESIQSMKETGVAVYHLKNFQRIIEVKKRDFPVISRVVDDKEYVFIRYYDFPEHDLEFNYIVAVKENGQWHSRSYQLKHHPWMMEEVVAIAKEAGFTEVMIYGGYDFSEFDPETSEDLLFVCELGEV